MLYLFYLQQTPGWWTVVYVKGIERNKICLAENTIGDVHQLLRSVSPYPKLIT